MQNEMQRRCHWHIGREWIPHHTRMFCTSMCVFNKEQVDVHKCRSDLSPSTNVPPTLKEQLYELRRGFDFYGSCDDSDDCHCSASKHQEGALRLSRSTIIWTTTSEARSRRESTTKRSCSWALVKKFSAKLWHDSFMTRHEGSAVGTDEQVWTSREINDSLMINVR